MNLPDTVQKFPFDVLVIGLNVVDVLARVPADARRDEKHRIDQLDITGGGPAGNAACGLAAMGCRVGFVARMGDDTISRTAKADFAAHGVRADLFIDDPTARPAVAVVEINAETGARTVYYSLSGYQPLTAADVGAIDLTGVRLLLCDGYEPAAALAALRAGGPAGIPSVLDLEAGDPAMLKQLLALGTHAILPRTGAVGIVGEAEPAEVLARLGRLTEATVVITDGIHGSWALDPARSGQTLHQPALPAAVVDTTGCGDVYHAAYAFALLDGLSLPARMQFAALAAAHVAERFGGRNDLPTRRALRDRAQRTTISDELRQYLHHANTGALPQAIEI